MILARFRAFSHPFGGRDHLVSPGRADAGRAGRDDAGDMSGRAPVIVHPPLGSGGRRVTARGESLGVAFSDEDLVEFLGRAGLPDAEELLDDPAWVKWRGADAHHYLAA
ncbi:hypothetical protein GCM10018782_47570 [Streptomyces griseoaurantiacus]|nr:hypothetical protein GCM10018782_47570 [Streptomyces griseoaurantiacus]